MTIETKDKLPYFAWKMSILTWAMDKYGQEKQIDQLIEECAELIVSLQHMKRGRTTWAEVAGEMADVTIMLDQMKTIDTVDKAVNDMVDYKLKRLEQRLVNRLVEESK